MIEQKNTLVDMDGEPFKSYYHPACIPSPVDGDYIQMLYNGKPSENHTAVHKVLGQFGQGLYLVENQYGESFAIARNDDFDTNLVKGWQEVETAA